MSDNSSKTAEKTATNVNRVAGVAEDQLRSFVERIEALDGDIKGLNSDKSEVYSEAKGSGFDLKAMRVVIRRRAMRRDDRIEQDHLVDLYERALSGRIEEREPQVAPEHKEAFACGKVDGLYDAKDNVARWPAGQYGHADYWRGHAEGEEERRLSRAPAREEGAPFGMDRPKRGPRRRRAAEAFAS